MKQVLLILFITGVSGIFLPSCQKDVQSSIRVPKVTVDTTIQSGTDYLLDLASYGYDDDIATIIQPGKYATVSELLNQNDLFTTVYHYHSTEKTATTDQVIISIKSNPVGGEILNNDSTLLYINLTLK